MSTVEKALSAFPDPDPHPRLVPLNTIPQPTAAPSRGDLAEALDRLGDASPGEVLLASDFDGTLAPIVTDPASARILPANLLLVDGLIDCGVHVAVISGRSQVDLAPRLSVDGTKLLGENGLLLPTAKESKALRRFNAEAGRLVAPVPGAWLECKAASSSIHFRRAPEAGPALQLAVLPLAERFGLAATLGRLVVDVRPQRADKALAMAVLIADIRPAAVIYAGDDAADESVFRYLATLPNRRIAVGVSSAERPVAAFSCCDLVVDGPHGVSTFLSSLLERMAQRAG